MASGIMPSAGGKHRTDAMLVDKLPEEINEMKIRDDKAEKEMEAAVVDGNGTGKGHIIVTTIGGKNGEPKQLSPSASACKMSNDEWRVVHDNLERRKYLMMEYLAKHAGLDMAALDRQLPLLESSKRLLGMRQTVEVPPGEDENTDSDVVEEDNGSDEGEWTEEEDGEEEEEEEDSDDET